MGMLSMISFTQAQEDHRITLDSLFLSEIESKHEPAKLLHAEPLFIDLIRDLGARKGEREWNVGFSITDNETYDKYEALIEYEWAPVNRLGLEVELPFSFYYPINGDEEAPSNKLNSFKMAAQYSFLVSEKYNTSLAIGYLHEFELTEFNNYPKESLFTGNLFNPFFVAAKRWGTNFHTLVYTGPRFTRLVSANETNTAWEINSTVFITWFLRLGIFIGVEINKNIDEGDLDMILRPQMRVGLSENLLIGIVTGVPVSSRINERFSSFLRLIYEPKHK